jgi:chemotaxis protein CheX
MITTPAQHGGDSGPSTYPFATLLRSTDRDRLLVQLVAAVWDSTLGSPILPREGSEDLDSQVRHFSLLSGRVQISGNWAGSVVMCVPLSLASECGALMYGRAAAELGPADVQDAWGELVNMVGGNLKALLPPPTQLSLPEVRQVSSWQSREEGTTVMNEVTFACLGERMRLTVLKRTA